MPTRVDSPRTVRLHVVHDPVAVYVRVQAAGGHGHLAQGLPAVQVDDLDAALLVRDDDVGGRAVLRADLAVGRVPAAAASIALSTNASSWSSGKTPWKVSTNRPSIIVITVGSVWIRSWSLMPVWVSTSTFTNTHLPPDRVANCSSLGVSFLHGWHQSA